MNTGNHIVVLFDGVCNLCNGAVQFIIKRDPFFVFKFASLQSEFGQSHLKKLNLPLHELHSFIVLENGIYYQRSDAALKIASNLKGPWSVLGIFKIIPKFIRDAIYTFIASNRYKVFGKQDSCMIPTPELQSRFIQ